MHDGTHVEFSLTQLSAEPHNLANEISTYISVTYNIRSLSTHALIHILKEKEDNNVLTQNQERLLGIEGLMMQKFGRVCLRSSTHTNPY